MTTSDHPDEPDFRDKNTATGRFSEVVCVRAGRVRLVLPEPGSALLQFVKLTGQFRRVIVWRDDPLVIKGVERLQLEHSQWPWHLLQDFNPPRLFGHASPRHLAAGGTGRPAEPLRGLSASFMSEFLGNGADVIAHHFQVDERTARRYRSRGREHWANLGAWPWAAPKTANSLPERWWESSIATNTLRDWIALAGLLNPSIASKYPKAAREELEAKFGLAETLEVERRRRSDAAELARETEYARLGYAGVPPEFRPEMGISTDDSYGFAALELFDELMIRTTGAGATWGPLARQRHS